MTTQNAFKIAETHEWADLREDGLVWVGISDHAQESLGDVVFMDSPKVGRHVSQGEACAVIESVKAASDIHAPVSGEIAEINSLLDKSPELINEKPYETWIFKIKPSSKELLHSELVKSMDLSSYTNSLNA